MSNKILNFVFTFEEDFLLKINHHEQTDIVLFLWSAILFDYF